MGLDIRIPIGAMFAILGAILVLFGVIANKEIYAKSLGININLWWGLVMLAFGALMFWLGRRGDAATKLAEKDAPTKRKKDGKSKRGH